MVTRAGPVDLEQVIADAVDRYRFPAEARASSSRWAGALPARVHGDADQLVTAFRNLIDNAVRYSPEGTRVGVGLSGAGTGSPRSL